jgi:hypothetical protein
MKYLTAAQYMRVERKAGGVHASNRDLIKALHSILSPLAKTAAKKELRHAMIRDILACNKSAKTLLRR